MKCSAVWQRQIAADIYQCQAKPPQQPAQQQSIRLFKVPIVHKFAHSCTGALSCCEPAASELACLGTIIITVRGVQRLSHSSSSNCSCIRCGASRVIFSHPSHQPLQLQIQTASVPRIAAASQPPPPPAMVPLFYLVLGGLFTVYALDLLMLVVVAFIARSAEVANLLKK